MKIIEALKKIKDLQRKANDLRDLVKNHCARSTLEEDKFENQKVKIEEWVQSHSDILKEILKLRIAIQSTNLTTMVDIELEGKVVSKSIAAWIHRRRDLAGEELKMYNCFTDRGIKEGPAQGPTDTIMIKIVRHFDVDTVLKKRDAYQSEPVIIDSKLEVINAITDLIEI